MDFLNVLVIWLQCIRMAHLVSPAAGIGSRKTVGICLTGAMSTQPQNHGREEFNICRECSRILQEEIERVLPYLRASSRCLEINHDMSEILPTGQDTDTAVTTRPELLAKISRYVLELQMIKDVWATHTRREPCLHNDLEKHFTRILCLLKPDGQQQQDCRIINYFSIPPDYPATLNYAATFTRDVYVTLRGFISQCVF